MFEMIVFPLAAVFYTVAILAQCRTGVLRRWMLAVFYSGLALDTFGTVYVCIWRTGQTRFPKHCMDLLGTWRG